MTTDILVTHAKFPDSSRITNVARQWDSMHGTVLVLDVTDIPDYAEPSDKHMSSRVILTLEELEAIIPAINKYVIAEERKRRGEGFTSFVRLRKLNPEKLLKDKRPVRESSKSLQTTVWDMEE